MSIFVSFNVHFEMIAAGAAKRRVGISRDISPSILGT